MEPFEIERVVVSKAVGALHVLLESEKGGLSTRGFKDNNLGDSAEGLRDFMMPLFSYINRKFVVSERFCDVESWFKARCDSWKWEDLVLLKIEFVDGNWHSFGEGSRSRKSKAC